MLKSDVLPLCSAANAKKCRTAVCSMQMASDQLAAAGFPPGCFGSLGHWQYNGLAGINREDEE